MALQLSPLPIILLIVQVLSRPNSGSHSWWEILPVLVMSSPEDRISHTFSLSSSQYIPSAHSYQCPCSLAGSGWGSEGMGRRLISIEFRVKNSKLLILGMLCSPVSLNTLSNTNIIFND